MKKIGKVMLMFFASTVIVLLAGCKPEVEVVSKVEHVHNIISSVIVEPTCSTKGLKTYTCTICEAVLITEEIATTEHTEDEGTVTTAATCVTKGERIYKCKTCNTVLRKEEIPELYSTPVDSETGNAATAVSKYIYFGVFPKTVLPENSTVTVDEAVSVEMGANTYYKGSDGNYYAKVTENCSSSSGYTYTDGTTVKQESASSTRYFKVEPIKWKVLAPIYNYSNKALLLAEDILTANVPYYETYSSRVIGESAVFPNNYKYSTIRAYLNGAYENGDEQTRNYDGKGFLQTAFTSNGQLLITYTEVDNRKETTGYSKDTYATDCACENTIDKIFLLSESEVINSTYGFAAAYNIYSYRQDKARIRVTTDYAKANHAYQSSSGGYGGYWWLRSPTDYNINYACYVYNDGYAYFRSGVNNTTCGVVPALSISF